MRRFLSTIDNLEPYVPIKKSLVIFSWPLTGTRVKSPLAAHTYHSRKPYREISPLYFASSCDEGVPKAAA